MQDRQKGFPEIEIGDQKRSRTIIAYSISGILMNLFLSSTKLVLGLRINSHAMVLDAVNGMSDMLTSILAAMSSILGNKSADKNHPMGYGRMEYLISLLITGIIMYVGVRAIIDAVDAIIHPHDPPDYNTVAIILMTASLFMKVTYGLLMRRKGKEIRSIAMIMAGTESVGDALISVGILAAIIVYRLTGVDIEHYICIAISLMILYTGWGMLKSSLTKILGERIDHEYESRIRNLLIMEEGVLNVSNLVIHNYGEGRYIGSVDIEVDEDMRAADITRLSRKLIRKAEGEGLKLTSVGISGTNIHDPEASETWDNILEIARKHENILRAHSFTVDYDKKEISFYVKQDYSAKDRNAYLQAFREEIQELYPDMKIEIFDAIDI